MPRGRTRVSCIAAGFFTVRATTEDNGPRSVTIRALLHTCCPSGSEPKVRDAAQAGNAQESTRKLSLSLHLIIAINTHLTRNRQGAPRTLSFKGHLASG